MLFRKKIMKTITFICTLAILVCLFGEKESKATTLEEDCEYEYTLFAIEKPEIRAENICLNGKTGYGIETMLDKQRTIIRDYFNSTTSQNALCSDNSIELVSEPKGDLGAINDIRIETNVINANNIVFYSKNGNIIIDCQDTSISGLIYAPNGCVKIKGRNVNLNSIVISKVIKIEADNVNINHNRAFAKYLGNVSDNYVEKKDIYTYTYDIFGNIVKVCLGNRELVSYEYAESFNNNLLCEKYGNGSRYRYDFEPSENSVIDISEYICTDGPKEECIQEENRDIFNVVYNGVVEKERYEYLENGKISSIFIGDSEIEYFYNKKGELSRVNNPVINKTYLYFYDDRGNILEKSEYDYSQKNDLQLKKKKNYTYDSIWKDQIDTNDAQKIVYDEIGNPIKTNGWKLEWEKGGQLERAEKDKREITYEYDMYGLRKSKTVNGQKITYKYCDRKIVEENTDDIQIKFLYDTKENIIGLSVNGEQYYYIKSAQGDVKKIVNLKGEIVVTYEYDPWGGMEGIRGKLADTIGEVNPIRYRGYYYDKETEMYYLVSRYYKPEICRFISPDNFLYLSVEQNMYQYCQNNPISNIDENGHLSWNGGIPRINSAADYQEYENLITREQKKLKTVGFKGIDKTSATEYLKTYNEFSISNIDKKAHFLAQCAIETEWGVYLTELGSKDYFASKDYGYKYRGGGFLQLTWKYNYRDFSNYQGDSNILSKGANYVAKKYPWTSAGWFWNMKKINSAINHGATVKDVTKIVNGGTRALDRRKSAYNKLKKLL